MKFLIFLISLFFISEALATKICWRNPVAKAPQSAYRSKKICEKLEQAECFAKCDEVSMKLNEEDRPKVNLKGLYALENCESFDACIERKIKKKCESGDFVSFRKNTLFPGFTIYCTGFETEGGK